MMSRALQFRIGKIIIMASILIQPNHLGFSQGLLSENLSYAAPRLALIENYKLGAIKDWANTYSQTDNSNTLSTTILVLDTSDSMNEADQSGVTKLEAAKEAVNTFLDIINIENESELEGKHFVGAVQFNNYADSLIYPTSAIENITSLVNDLEADGGTAMPDGLAIALEQLDSVGASPQKIIVLMTDGIPNIGLGGDTSLAEEEVRRQVLELARQAGSKGYCLYTIGFGEPQMVGDISGDLSIDEEFLRQVSSEAGCGQYLNAQNMMELIQVYIKLRHGSLGKILLETQGTILQGEEVALPEVVVDAGRESLVFTLIWSGSKIEIKVKDPRGNILDQGSADIWKFTTEKFAVLIVQNPIPGVWQPILYGAETPPSGTKYYALLSVRPAIITPLPQPMIISPVPPTFVPPTGNPRIGKPEDVCLFGLVLLVALLGFFFLIRSPKSRSAPQSAYLMGVNGMYQNQRIDLPREAIIGRSQQVYLSLPQRNVSRYHCRIWSDGVNWYIQDLQSQLGTYVNGQPIHQVMLRNQDFLQIGENTFRFYTS